VSERVRDGERENAMMVTERKSDNGGGIRLLAGLRRRRARSSITTLEIYN
jgi:hypothetical protein